MECDFVYICTKKYMLITKCNAAFEGTEKFDIKCGLKYVYTDSEKEPEHVGRFKFKVEDVKLYMLAKIKFGI